MEKLNNLLSTIELFHEMQLFDSGMVVCDYNAKVLKHIQANGFALSLKEGDYVKAGIIPKCLKTRQSVSEIIPEDVYGLRIKTHCIPIIEEDGIVSGALSMGTTLDWQDHLSKISNQILGYVNQTAEASETVAQTAVSLAHHLGDINSKSQNVLESLNATENILKSVRKIAQNSNMLGLNASIEAARAGSLGNGFNVVAKEIRQMALDSEHAVEDIRTILDQLRTEIFSISKRIEDVSKESETQASSTEEISANMMALSSVVDDLESSAQLIG